MLLHTYTHLTHIHPHFSRYNYIPCSCSTYEVYIQTQNRGGKDDYVFVSNDLTAFTHISLPKLFYPKCSCWFASLSPQTAGYAPWGQNPHLFIFVSLESGMVPERSQAFNKYPFNSMNKLCIDLIILHQLLDFPSGSVISSSILKMFPKESSNLEFPG